MYNECRHIMPSGARCHGVAMSNKAYCYFHARLHRAAIPLSPSRDQTVTISAPEDSSGISIALAQVINALGENRIDRQRASLILYGLQIAAQVIGKPGRLPTESVRTLSFGEAGEELAPESFVCEPGVDCDNCCHQDECSNYEDSSDNQTYEPFDEEDEDEEEEEEEGQEEEEEEKD